jgi:hypothetical protein
MSISGNQRGLRIRRIVGDLELMPFVVIVATRVCGLGL